MCIRRVTIVSTGNPNPITFTLILDRIVYLNMSRIHKPEEADPSMALDHPTQLGIFHRNNSYDTVVDITL